MGEWENEREKDRKREGEKVRRGSQCENDGSKCLNCAAANKVS